MQANTFHYNYYFLQYLFNYKSINIRVFTFRKVLLCVRGLYFIRSIASKLFFINIIRYIYCLYANVYSRSALIRGRSRVYRPRVRSGTSRAAPRVGRSGVSLVPAAGPGRSTGRTKVRRVVAPAGRQGISPRCSATACIASPLPCLVLPYASLAGSSPRRYTPFARRTTVTVMLTAKLGYKYPLISRRIKRDMTLD